MRELRISRAGRFLFSRPLDKELLKIGRHPTCDIVLDDPSICRIHVVITRDLEHDHILVTHLGLGGASYKNGQSITHSAFGLGDELRLGRLGLYSITLSAIETADLVLVPSGDALIPAPIARVLWSATPAEMNTEPKTGEIDVGVFQEPIYLLTRRKAG
jgi:hypothetical protein